MSAKKRLLILIPDGTGIKNYLLSGFIKLASEKYDIILAHNFNLAMHKEINISEDNFKHITIPIYKETFQHKFIRESLCYARLKYNSKLKANPSIMVNWRRRFNNISKKIFYKGVELYGSYLSQNYQRIKKKTEYYHHNLIRSSSIEAFSKVLESEAPHLILSTHQRSLYNVPFFASAKKLKIPTISFIYSWDNMPKARIPYFSNYFFVWSEYMKQEFDQYYPEIEKKNIKITGTPQFEFYSNKGIIETKSDYFNKHGLDIERPLVCYSGDDVLTSPFDADYLRDMAESFSQMEESQRPQIILRPCPVDDGKRFESVLAQYPNICYAPADWFTDKTESHWAVKFPKQNDIKELVNLAFHADAVVNLGSTMAHDFAMFDKPAFYVNYMPQPSKQSLNSSYAKNWSVKTIYKYEHFKSMANLGPVYWINQKQDFINIPDRINKHNSLKQKDQKQWRDKIIGKEIYKQSSQLIVEELQKIT
jgi:hypothetical protein